MRVNHNKNSNVFLLFIIVQKGSTHVAHESDGALIQVTYILTQNDERQQAIIQYHRIDIYLDVNE